MTPQQVELLKIALTVFGTALGAVLPLLPILLPLLLDARKNGRQGLAFASVSRAILLATNHAAVELAKGLQEAQLPTSPGGRVVMPDERRDVMARAVGVGLKWLLEQGLRDSVVRVYGSEEALRQALTVGVGHQLNKLAGEAAMAEPLVPPAGSVPRA